MSELPLVTVITPTWQRHDMLLERCVPAVAAQTYPRVEHIVISDGPDEALIAKITARWPGYDQPFRYAELDAHDPAQHWGHHARSAALELATGELIAYVDDDDALRPEHCNLLAALLAARPDCGFALSRMASHRSDGEEYVIGHGTPCCGNLGTPMIMHRREMTQIATWDHADTVEDWQLALAWMNAGVIWCQADAETVDVWPSVYR